MMVTAGTPDRFRTLTGHGHALGVSNVPLNGVAAPYVTLEDPIRYP